MDDGSIPMVSFAVFVMLLAVSAVMYGFQSAIQNISLKALEEYEEKNRGKTAKLDKIMDSPGKFVLTVRAVTTITALHAGFFQTRMLGEALGGRLLHYAGLTSDNQFALTDTAHVATEAIWGISYVLAGIFFLWLILLVGILFPKIMGQRHCEKWTFSLYQFAYLVLTILTPLTVMTGAVLNLVLKMCGIDSREMEDKVTEEDIVSMVNEGHENGVLLASEAEMITNIFEFDDKEVRDIMTHRTNIVAVDGNITLREAVTFMLPENYSRFPVYVDDIDNIIGIIHLKDTMIFHEQENYDDKKLTDIEGLIRQVEFIPETRNINVVFKDMQREKLHMQIVIDEYGQTSGIVAMEDILEEIVGNIQDEYDEEEENIVEKEENVYVVNGMTPLEELDDALGIKLENDDYDTVNGYLTSRLDRILSEGEHPTLEIDGVIYRVLEVHNKMISKVQLTIPAPEIEEKESENENEQERSF